MTRAVVLAVAVVCATAAAVTVHSQAPEGDEEAARRRLDSGRKFLAERNYKEALADLENVLRLYPKSTSADDALLEIAAYHLNVERNLQAAERRNDEFLSVYPNTDSAAMAYILEGRIALAKGHGAQLVTEAVSSFDRVERLFPGSEAIPEALYRAAEASRIGRREDAIDRFARLPIEYPRSRWAAPALLGAARALVASGQPIRAMEQLQRVRNEFAASREEAAQALEWNTILYRLHVRAPAQPPYVFGRGVTGSSGRLRNVADIAVDQEDRLLVATRTAVTIFDDAGTAVGSRPSAQLTSLFVDGRNRTLVANEAGSVGEPGSGEVPLAVPDNNGRPRPVRIDAVVTTSFGEYVVASENQRGLLRFTPDGQLVDIVGGQIRPRRLAISELDDVAALDPDARTVTVLDRDGQVVVQLGERGAGYQFRRPVDVAFDRLGYLYVLDRQAVFVFAPWSSTLVATFAPPERAEGAFGSPELLALDGAGRLHVFDSRSNQVQVYR